MHFYLLWVMAVHTRWWLEGSIDCIQQQLSTGYCELVIPVQQAGIKLWGRTWLERFVGGGVDWWPGHNHLVRMNEVRNLQCMTGGVTQRKAGHKRANQACTSSKKLKSSHYVHVYQQWEWKQTEIRFRTKAGTLLWCSPWQRPVLQHARQPTLVLVLLCSSGSSQWVGGNITKKVVLYAIINQPNHNVQK